MTNSELVEIQQLFRRLKRRNFNSSSPVSSIFGRIGAITAQLGDYNFSDIGSKPTTLSGYGITDAQSLDSTLTALAGVSTAADKLIYSTGVDTFSSTDFSSFARTILDDANASSVRSTIGAGISNFDGVFSSLTSKPTTLSGYGITDSTLTWTKITKTFSNFSTAATTNTIELFVLPAKGVIHAIQINPSTTFSGGLIATYSISVGITGTLLKYAPAVTVFTGAVLPAISVIAGVESLTATTSIKVTAVSTVANLSAATQGSVDIWVLTSTLP